MSEILQTSVSIEFTKDETTEDLGPPAITLEQDDVQAPYGYAHARMYFVGQTPTVTSTSGYSVQTVNNNVTSDELEFLMFQGQEETSFPTPVVSNVSLTPLGRLIGAKGETVSSVTFKVDVARGTVKASVPLYGTVQAEYKSRFHRLQAQFREVPGAKDDPRFVSEFAPLVLVARQPKGDPASLGLTPPTKDQNPNGTKNGGYGAADRSTGERIVLELDETFPVTLSHNRTGTHGITAIARVAVYSPHGGVSCYVSRGVVEGDPYAMDETLEREESVNFIGAQSASVKYPPANGVTVSQSSGTVFSQQTPGNIFHFATWPQMVTIADWFSYGAYQVTGARQVIPNEIVATTSGVVVPVTGQVRASYSTKRTFVMVYWDKDGRWFPPVILTATDAWGNAESITISAPERRGR